MTEELLPLTGQEQIEATAVRVTVLGSFSVERGAEPFAFRPGKPAHLVALLAAHGGRAPAEQAIEELWPGVDHRQRPQAAAERPQPPPRGGG